MRLIALLTTLLLTVAAFAQPQTRHKHALPFLPAADSIHQGSIRLVNHSGRAGWVRIYAVDDTGARFGPANFKLTANQARDIAVRTIERRIGEGEGHWWFDLSTTLDITPLAYIQMPGGPTTAMHDVVAAGEHRYSVPLFNPASSLGQRSWLRIVNPNNVYLTIAVDAMDDAGHPAEGRFERYIQARTSTKITAQDLEDTFGEGVGKWHLSIWARKPVWVMNLLSAPDGHLANLSTSAPRLVAPRSLKPGEPPQATGLEAHGGIASVYVSWDLPAYDDHKSTWIYRSRQNIFATAQRIATSPWMLYHDRNLRADTTYYYWIRWENRRRNLGLRSDVAHDKTGLGL